MSGKIKNWANESINSELKFSKARLSFIRHFPSLTLSLYDFSLTGSAPFKNDTLIAGKELAFGIDLGSIFKSKIAIEEFYLENSNINIQADSAGNANYNIYKSSDTAATKQSGSTASLQIKKIIISKCRLLYNDRSLPMLIEANGMDYSGKGDLARSLFDLQSNISIKDFNFYYAGKSYIQNKTIKADLITSINTNTLALKFAKNNLLINSLPVDFKGRFDFIKNGYSLDFKLTSGNTGLHDIFTILPPQYLKWLSKVDMKGNAVFTASLAGNYIASSNTNPNLNISFSIADGFIKHQAAPQPITHLHVKTEISLPGLNTNRLQVNIDTLSLNVNNDYLHSSLHTKGWLPLQVKGILTSKINLQNLDLALGIDLFDVKGNADISFIIDGIFNTGIRKKFRGHDTIITSIPPFQLKSALSNGYFKYASLPAPIQNIAFNLNTSSGTSNYKDVQLHFTNLNAELLNSYLKGYFHLKNLNNIPVDADIKADVELADLTKAFPIESFIMSGKLAADIKANGNIYNHGNLFPKINATIVVDNGNVKTSLYPNAISNIQINLAAKDETANIKGLTVAISPLKLVFEGEAFAANAVLKNFDNLQYDVAAKGKLNIGKIYRVFSKKGYDASGFIEANIVLKGRQSDAANGNLQQLSNTGELVMKDIKLSYEEYPQPFYIKTGTLKFDNDKIWLLNTIAKYAGNQFVLNGYLLNILNYTLKNEVLKGELQVETGNIKVDDFMAFASTTSSSGKPSGVVLLPNNLSLVLSADAKRVLYNGLVINDLRGSIKLDSSKLILQQTKLRVAGAIVTADGFYKSVNPNKAFFDFKLKADSFDIAKAYREVKMFRDMATSASSTKGLVSLDYKLSGTLNNQMLPVYNTLKGGGILRLENISVNGLRLFSEIGKATGRDSVNNPNLKKVVIKSTIANNIITIERVKMKVFGFRPRFEGQTNFDGRLHFKARLGLPPLGIIGIPLTITGTSSNPIVKLRKSQEQSLEAEKPEDE